MLSRSFLVGAFVSSCSNRRKDVLALSEQIVEVVNGISVGEYVILEETGVVHTRSFDLSGDGSVGGASDGPRRR